MTPSPCTVTTAAPVAPGDAPMTEPPCIPSAELVPAPPSPRRIVRRSARAPTRVVTAKERGCRDAPNPSDRRRAVRVSALRAGVGMEEKSLSALRSSWVRWEIALARGARPAFLPAACSLGSPRPARFVRLRAGVRSARAPGADATPPTRPPFRAPEGRNRSRARVRGPAPRPRSASPARIGGAPIPGPGGASSTDRGIVRSP